MNLELHFPPLMIIVSSDAVGIKIMHIANKMKIPDFVNENT
jgi:hypothetical protein